MGNLTYDRFNSLPPAEKAYLAHMAQKNDEILVEIETAKRKPQAYEKLGPMYTHPRRFEYSNDTATP